MTTFGRYTRALGAFTESERRLDAEHAADYDRENEGSSANGVPLDSRELYAGARTSFGRGGRYVGTMLAPKPGVNGLHLLFDVRSTTRDPDEDGDVPPSSEVVLVKAGMPSPTMGGDPDVENRIYGRGYYEDDDWPVLDDIETAGGYRDRTPERQDKCVRIHTPIGVRHKGQGHGAVLYAGMALNAMENVADAGVRGIYSIEATRDPDAEKLWASALNPKSGPLAAEKTLVVPGGYYSGYTQRTYRQMRYQFITAQGLGRWGCTVFSVFPLPGARGTPLAPVAGQIAARRGLSSEWDAESVDLAFGTDDGSGRCSALSPTMAELLQRADVGPSVALVEKIAGVLASFDPAWARTFLARADVAKLLGKRPAGKALVKGRGRKSALAGLGEAGWADVERAMTRAGPLVLPPVSVAAERAALDYPED